VASELGEVLLSFAGKAKGLPHDMAENRDHYLYGTPKWRDAGAMGSSSAIR
jgi:hypothetical protein